MITDQKLPTNRGAAVHGHQPGEMTVVRCSSRCGLQGVRVGDASNFGPQLPRHRSPARRGRKTHLAPSRASAELLDTIQEDLEDTQIRTRTRRRVVPSDEGFSSHGACAVLQIMTVLCLEAQWLQATLLSGLEKISDRTDSACFFQGVRLTRQFLKGGSSLRARTSVGDHVARRSSDPRGGKGAERSVPDQEDPCSLLGTVSLGGASEAGVDAVDGGIAHPVASTRPTGGFCQFGCRGFESVFSRRAHLLRTIPFVLKGASRFALRTCRTRAGQ